MKGMPANHKPTVWSEEEDKIIDIYYPVMGSKVVSLLPGRTKDSCRTRASMRGIKYKK